MAIDEHLSTLLDIDRIIHEPSRLVLLSILHTVESADFLYLQGETGLTKGNLSAHLSKLEQSGYVTIEKTYKGKTPLTLCKITDAGTQAFEHYLGQLQQFLTYISG